MGLYKLFRVEYEIFSLMIPEWRCLVVSFFFCRWHVEVLELSCTVDEEVATCTCGVVVFFCLCGIIFFAELHDTVVWSAV
jgi:hypothetical protein